jgi:endonuclease-3
MKRPFHADEMLHRIEAAVRPFPKAAMFDLADKGYTSLFEQLIACILSIRTYDEVSLVAAQRLFASARTPAQLAALTPLAIDRLIHTVTFHDRKATQIHTIAKHLVDHYSGELPCDRALVLSFSGVGPKCANLAMGIACGDQVISVDIHVHRVTNRWGYVKTGTPEKTMSALEKILPRDQWLNINRLLVPFGKHICTGQAPKCSSCPVLEYCQQVGVSAHR